jgi:GH25 family lysozyme M1 (1,4-beta-N-acetylmuramidase)
MGPLVATDQGVNVSMRISLLSVFAVSAAAFGAIMPTAGATENSTFTILRPELDFAGAQIYRHEYPQIGPLLPHTTVPQGQENKPTGSDVSGHTGNVDWKNANGVDFVYVKRSEGTDYISPAFNQQYGGAKALNMTRGSYHFALPDRSDGVTQANFFLDSINGWFPNGHVLPPAVDLEYNPYGDACYGKSPADIVTWIRQFTDTVKNRIKRLPVIYTSTYWWNKCTGNNTTFGGSPLWIPRYGPQVGPLPAGWSAQAIWQYSISGSMPGDQNVFNGDAAELQTLLDW